MCSIRKHSLVRPHVTFNYTYTYCYIPILISIYIYRLSISISIYVMIMMIMISLYSVAHIADTDSCMQRKRNVINYCQLYINLIFSHWAFSPNLGISERYERCSTPQRLPSSSYATHMPWSRTGVEPANNIMGSGHVTPTAKNTGGGADPPKGCFSALGAAWRSPSAAPMRSSTPQPPPVPLPVEPASQAAIPPS